MWSVGQQSLHLHRRPLVSLFLTLQGKKKRPLFLQEGTPPLQHREWDWKPARGAGKANERKSLEGETRKSSWGGRRGASSQGLSDPRRPSTGAGGTGIPCEQLPAMSKATADVTFSCYSGTFSAAPFHTSQNTNQNRDASSSIFWPGFLFFHLILLNIPHFEEVFFNH